MSCGKCGFACHIPGCEMAALRAEVERLMRVACPHCRADIPVAEYGGRWLHDGGWRCVSRAAGAASPASAPQHDEVAALRSEVEKLRASCDSWRARASRQTNELAALRAVAEAAKRRLRYRHNDTCDLALGDGYPCTCGHDALLLALDALTTEASSPTPQNENAGPGPDRSA